MRKKTGGVRHVRTVLPLPAPMSFFLRLFRAAENLLITLVLAALVVLPLIDILLRKTSVGFTGVNPLVRNLVFAAAMLGGALAARENRLLSLSTLSTFLKGRWKTAAQVSSGCVAVAVTALLCVASVQFVQSSHEYAADRTVAFGIPVWMVQVILPAGFAVIALRLLWLSAPTWAGRAVCLFGAAAIVVLGIYPPVAREHLVPAGLVLLGIATVLGAPIYSALGGAALVLFWGEESPIASISLDFYQMAVNPALPAIPLFTLAGYFLAEGGASKRLIRVFQALVGQLRGGPAIMTALVCAFFTSFTGASGVTILALGGLLMPVLLAARYSERNAIGLLTGAGSLGLLLPPCLPLILYAIVATTRGTSVGGAGVTIQEMFLGGVVPGLVLIVLTAAWGIVQAPRLESDRPRFDAREALGAIWDAKWELLLPVVALVSIFGGFATPVEAAAITAGYAFIAETLIYRDLRIVRDTPRVMVECGLLVGGVLLILGVAMGFTNYLVNARVPDQLVHWVTMTIESPWVFLLALNVFLLAVGCLMDIFSAIVVVVPLIVPVALAFGIDPIHLGIIFLANMELGYLTPPVGMNLFISSYRFKKPILGVFRSVIPMFLVLLIGVLLITYVPWLSTALPRWVGSSP